MSQDISRQFDPFRVVLSFASEADNADMFIEMFTGVGLAFNVSLDSPDDYSHGNRIRALRPRVLEAYDRLSPEAKLAAANSATARFRLRIQSLQHLPKFQGVSEKMAEALQKIGWGFQDDRLIASDPEVREMFFPKGSRWDAFVAIRELVDKARREVMVVDPYCDHALFDMLQSSGLRSMTIRVLCRNNAKGLKAEAQAFVAQYQQVTIELRTSSDFHDRFLVLDQAICIHIGASINHAGTRAFMISAVEDARNRDALIKAVDEAWTTAVPV